MRVVVGEQRRAAAVRRVLVVALWAALEFFGLVYLRVGLCLGGRVVDVCVVFGVGVDFGVGVVALVWLTAEEGGDEVLCLVGLLRLQQAESR